MKEPFDNVNEVVTNAQEESTSNKLLPAVVATVILNEVSNEATLQRK